MRWALLASVLGFAVACAASCGGTSAMPAATCVAGQSIACAGTGGCAGSQVCARDGTYGACSCGTPDADSGTDATVDDSSIDDVAVPPDAPPFMSPKDLPGLVLWLTPKSLVADPAQPTRIKRWSDQSGNGNDAQGFASNGVNYLTEYDPSAVNGQDAVICHANGGGLTIADSPTLHFGTGDFAIAMVLKYQFASGNGDFFWGQFDNFNMPTKAIWIRNTQGNFPEFDVLPTANVAAPTPANYYGKFNIVIARGPSPLELRFGADLVTGPGTKSPTPDVGVSLCRAEGNPSGPFYELSEVVAIKGKLSDANTDNLRAYFKTKFALP